MKRAPLLADQFLATPPHYYRQYPYKKGFVDTTRANLMEAKRFVLSDDAVRYICKIVKEHPRLIADAQEFAIPPFKKMWVEYDAKVMFESITGGKTDSFADDRMGFLIAGPVIRTIMSGLTEKPMPAPIQYLLNVPFTHETEQQFCQQMHISRTGIDALFWGQFAGEFISQMDLGTLKSLRANHSAELIWDHRESEGGTSGELAYKIMALTEEFRGDFRTVLSILLFLNRTQTFLEYEERPHQRGMVGNKSSVLLKHTVINIKVDPSTIFRTLVAGSGHEIWKRLHDVRGHFCHNWTARNAPHVHEWKEDPDPKVLRWYCACGGLRWWKKEHKRGREDKGMVTSEYKVI